MSDMFRTFPQMPFPGEGLGPVSARRADPLRRVYLKRSGPRPRQSRVYPERLPWQAVEGSSQ